MEAISDAAASSFAGLGEHDARHANDKTKSIFTSRIFLPPRVLRLPKFNVIRTLIQITILFLFEVAKAP